VSERHLVAAISNAGGFGVIACGAMTPALLDGEIAGTKGLTDKPFGVDLLAASPESLEESVDVIINGGADSFVAGLGVPMPIMERLKKAGLKVMVVGGAVKHAIKAEQAGCDAVILQGGEGGGHTGLVGTMPLVAQAVEAVKIPVIAAGGIYDGRGLAASLALGAQGVWMGTRFIASKEAHAGQAYKEAIVEMSESDTTISRGFTGKTLRALKNETTDKFEKEPAKPFPAQVMESAQMNRLGPIAGITENLDRSFQCFAVGQGGGGVREVLTCADIVANTVAEAEATLKRIGKLAA
jgi:enoyl-[acyl-carrier protein] reductase II